MNQLTEIGAQQGDSPGAGGVSVGLFAFFAQSAAAGTLLAALVYAGNLVLGALDQRIAAERRAHLAEQPPYESELGLPSASGLPPVLWLETGRENDLLHSRITMRGYAAKLLDFSPGGQSEPTADNSVSWHAKASGRATIQFFFPPEQAKSVAVYFSDRNSYWRATRIDTGGETTIAYDFSPGRWYTFPVTPEESARGRKVLHLFQLTGENISVSAVAMY